MPNSGYADYKGEECRLRILQMLYDERDDTLSSTLIRKQLYSWGHNTSAEYVLAQLDILNEVGGVRLMASADPEIVIATLTNDGREHVERRKQLRRVAPVIDKRG